MKYIVYLIPAMLIITLLPIHVSSVGVDKPIWHIGDKWIYDIYYNETRDDNSSSQWFFDHLKLNVINISDSYYILSLNGRVKGKLKSSITLDMNNGILHGTAMVKRDNLAFYKCWIYIQGSQSIGFIDVPVIINISVTSIPPFTSLKFPLYSGDNWYTQQSEFKINISILINDNPVSIPPYNNITFNSTEMKCEDIENIEVKAGRYNCFKIIDTKGLHQTFFSPEAGAAIKSYIHNETMELYMELVDTTFKPTCYPSIPDGPIIGRPNESYEYCTTAVSLTNIYYKWSWGDNNTTEWLGPYKSMEISCSQHTWSKPGVYEIKVKTREENGIESPWSQPLLIHIYNDTIPPYIEFTQPKENSIYLGNTRIASIPFGIFLLGDMDIIFNVWDNESGIKSTQLYINDILSGEFYNQTCIYHFDAPSGKYTINIIAIDNYGNEEIKSISLFKIL